MELNQSAADEEELLWLSRPEHLWQDAMSPRSFDENSSISWQFYVIRRNATVQELVYERLRQRVYQVIIPIVCLFGVVGNSFSVYVFTRRWLTKYMDQLERSATAGLISLALSDCCFCLVGLPAIFIQYQLPRPLNASSPSVIASYYYTTYRAPAANLFLLYSTWIIVLISLERFVAVSYAIKARWIIRVRLTIAIHAAVFVTSLLICLPLALKNRIKAARCNGDAVCLYVEPWQPLANHQFTVIHQIVWASVGTFIPLFLLVGTSVRLLLDLYRSKAFGFADPDRYCTPQITAMIVGILVTFTALVCPSMFVEFFKWPYLARHAWPSLQQSYSFRVAIVITNLLQAVKFASNFLLYCAISREFRKSFDFRRLRESLTSSLRRESNQAPLHNATEKESSACQLIALHLQSRSQSQDGKENAMSAK